MSPFEYKNVYQNNQAKLPDGNSVLLNSGIKYLNLGYGGHSAQLGKSNLLRALGLATGGSALSLNFQLKGQQVSMTVSQYSIRMPHGGKGSPDDIRKVVFALAYCLGIGRDRLPSERAEREVQQHMRNLFGPELSRLGSDPGALTMALNKYCVDHIGLDCNGFVSNYFGLDRQTPVSTFGDSRLRRKKTSEIQPRDVVVWHNPNPSETRPEWQHVAVIDKVQLVSDDTVSVTIVEADNGWLHFEDNVKLRFVRDQRGFHSRTAEARNWCDVYVAAPPPDAKEPNN